LEKKNASLKKLIQVSQTEMNRLDIIIKNYVCNTCGGGMDTPTKTAPKEPPLANNGDPRSHAERIITDISQRQDEAPSPPSVSAGNGGGGADGYPLDYQSRGPTAYMYDPLEGQPSAKGRSHEREPFSERKSPSLPAHLEQRRDLMGDMLTKAQAGSAVSPTSLREIQTRLDRAENRVKELEGGIAEAAAERRELRYIASSQSRSNERDEEGGY